MQKTDNIQMTNSDKSLKVDTYGDQPYKSYTQDEAYEVCKNALDKFGTYHQQSKAIEEFLELSLELVRDNNSDNIIDELADANIMLMQMGLLFGHDKVVQRMFYKLDRLERLIVEGMTQDGWYVAKTQDDVVRDRDFARQQWRDWNDKAEELAKTIEIQDASASREIDRLQGNWEAAEKEVQALKLENARLREALRSLANEAEGFLYCADAIQHGVTNMQVLSMRINEARAALDGKK